MTTNNETERAGLKRYEPTVVIDESRGRLTASGAAMEEKYDGRWIRFADVAALLAADKAGGEPTKRQYETALRQWDHWKAYALELQSRLVKYEGGSPMVLNASTQPQAEALSDDVVKDAAIDAIKALLMVHEDRPSELARKIAEKILDAAIDAAMLKEGKS